MKINKKSVIVLFALIFNMIFPAGLVLAQAAPIGNLRTWENVVTTNSAELHFSFTSAGYFRIDYGTTAGTYPLSSVQISLTNTSYPYYYIIIRDLTPSTTYYYRLATKALSPSTAEWGYTGESSFTTTAPDTAPPTMSAVAASEVTSTAANITFTASESGYAKVEYGPSGTFSSTTSEISVTAGSPTTIPLSGLAAGTTYGYRIVARDSAGNSATSAGYTFTTVSVVNCFVKVNGSIINSVIATDRNNCYTQTSFGSNNCSYYNSYFHEGSNTLEQYFGQTDRVNSDTCVKPTTTQISQVQGLAATISGTSVTLSWQAVSGISTYNIHRGTTADFVPIKPSSATGSNYNHIAQGNVLSYTNSNLSAGTYYYKIVAQDVNGVVGPASAAVSATIQPTSTTSGGAPIISGAQAVSITANTAQITWTCDPACYGTVEYGFTTGLMYVSGRTATLSTSPIVNLIGLAPKTTYWVRAYASGASGPSSIATNLSFTTPDSSPPRVFPSGKAGLSVLARDPAGTLVSGVEVKLGLSGGSGTESAYYRESTGFYDFSALGAGNYNLSVFPSSSRTDLNPVTAYAITVSDTDIITKVIYLTYKSGTTTADTTAPTISGIYAGTITATSTLSTLVYFTSNEAGYAKVEYGPSGNFTLSSPEASVAAGVSSSIYLGGLTAGTNYSYRIVARDSANNSAISGSYTFTTSTGTTANTVPTVSSIGTKWVYANSAQLYWSCDQFCYGQVEYGTSPNYSGSSYTPWTTTLLFSPAVDLTGLTANTTYYARVYAKNSSGLMSAGVPFGFTTPSSTTTPPTGDTTAPVISGVHVMTNTASYTQIMWSTDDLSYGRVEYDATTAYGAATSWSANLSYSPAVDITGLASGKTYHYRVRAKNAAGLESVSTTDYTFVAGGTGEPTPTVAFAVDPARTYPQTGSNNIPMATPKIQVEFTKAIDTASVTGGSVYLGFLGAATTATSLSGKLDVFNNGFNFVFSEPLKAGVSYNFIVRGTIRASSGESLGGDYALTFTTAKATETIGQGVIKGTVKDSAGKPVAGAYVSLRTSAYGTSYGQSSQTTAYGEYNFAALAAGTYTLEVYPPAAAGGFTRPVPATVTLGSGETVIRDFTFATSNATIKGMVKFSDGTPVTDAEVSAYRREGSGWVSSPVTPDGGYSLTVQVGSWMISIRPRYVSYATTASSYPIIGGGSSWVYTQPPQEVYITAESDIRTVDFIVPKQTSSTSISGTLQRGDNEPIIAGSAFVRLLGQAGIALSVPVALGGRFTTAITPGNYRLYVDVVDPNLSSPEIPPVSIGPGEQKDLGLIIIPAATALISGRVTALDGRGVSGVKVSGWRANSADSAGATTDESGNYTLKVSPGDWTVSLVSSPDQSYSNTAPPQFVRVKGGRVFGINFVLAQSDGLVNGLVTDEFGAILSDFYGFVRVGSKNGFSLPGGAPVERGQFSLRLPAGSYILYMELPPNAGYGWPAPVPVTVTTGESAKVVMKMATAAQSAVIGFLVDRAGNKITNVPFKVYATGSSGGWFSALIDMPLGYYKLRVPAGTWYIGYDVADSSGQYQRPRDAKKKITVAAGAIASLDLPVIEQNGRVNGVVRDSDGNSISNIWVAISGQPFSKFGRETVVAQRYLNGATSDQAGQFSLPVPPGTYYVRAFVPPSLGLTNPDEQIVKVAAGEEATVELALRSIETTISGITTIAGVPSWAFVWAWSNKGGYTESYADEKGNFKLKVSSGDIWHVGAMSEIKRDTYKASEVAINISRPGSTIPLSLDLAPLGVKLPELVNISGQADQMTVATNDAGAKLVVPANAASTEGALAVSITPEVITPSQGADRVVGFGYEFDVRNEAGQEVNAFNSELTVSIPYDPRELTRLSLRPADLSLRYWDEINSTWQEVMNAIVDEINQVITGSLAHLTRFAIIAATDTTPPGAPTKVKAKVGGDGIVLTWVKPKDKDLQYVKIYRSTKPDALGEGVANNITAATYKDSGLKRGATYYYLARAVDAAGNESTNTAAVAVAVKGSGTLGKAVARSVVAKVEKLSLKGSITDINLVASTMEIKDSRGQKTVVKFNPKTTFKKDGKAAKTTDVKAGNTIDAQATKEAGVITLVSAVVTSVKVKVKAELKVSQFAGQRSKLKVKIIEARGVVAGAGIEKGQEATLNIEGVTVNANGQSTPVESLVPQKNVTIEGVIENGAVTVTKIIAPPLPKVKVQPASQGKIGDQAASVAR